MYNLITSTGELKDWDHAGGFLVSKLLIGKGFKVQSWLPLVPKFLLEKVPGFFSFPSSCLGTGLEAKLLLRLNRGSVEVVKKQSFFLHFGSQAGAWEPKNNIAPPTSSAQPLIIHWHPGKILC